MAEGDDAQHGRIGSVAFSVPEHGRRSLAGTGSETQQIEFRRRAVDHHLPRHVQQRLPHSHRDGRQPVEVRLHHRVSSPSFRLFFFMFFCLFVFFFFFFFFFLNFFFFFFYLFIYLFNFLFFYLFYLFFIYLLFYLFFIYLFIFLKIFFLFVCFYYLILILILIFI